MNMFSKYLGLELKRSFQVLRKTITNFILVIAILVAAVIAISYTFMQAQVIKKVDVAIVAPGDDELTKIAIDVASSVDTIQAICEVHQLDEETAIEEMQAGNLQAVILLPVNFYQNVYSGENTPAEILITEDTTMSVRLFREILRDIVALLQIAESGVYATYDMADEEKHVMRKYDMGELLTEEYIKEILSRNKLFQENTLSPYGDVNSSEYLFLSACFVVLLMVGLSLSYLYCKESRVVEQKLQIYGLNPWKRTLLKMIVMTLVLYILTLILYILGMIATEYSSMQLVGWSPGVLLTMLLICVGISSYFHMIYSLAGNGMQATSVLLIGNIIMILMSGLLIPTAYLPMGIGKIGECLPLYYWMEYAMDIFYGPMEWISAVWVILFTVICLGVGGVAEWRKS